MASRETARRLISERQVLVDGSFADKPARMVDPGQAIVFVSPPPPFVSRAGTKLAGALDEFGIDPAGARCLDAGSSTGGFTDCLLQRGATHVVAVDVGTNQLHEKIRANSRVEVREQTDVRSLRPDHFEAPFDLIVGDLSFISLRLVLPALVPLLSPSGQMLMLVKPQFEAGKIEASKAKGVITDPDVWVRTLHEVLLCARQEGVRVDGLAPSSIRGGQGNVEFVAWLAVGGPTIDSVNEEEVAGSTNDAVLIDRAVDRAQSDPA